MKAFSHEGARDFDDGFWLHLIHDGSTKKLLEYCQDTDGNLCYFRATQGHSGGIPISPEIMRYTLIPYNWKEYLYHRGSSWVFQSVLVREEKRRRRLAKQSFWHHWILLERTRKRRSLISIAQFLKKFHMKLVGNATKMLYIRYETAHKTEIEYFSKGLRHQGPHPRPRWRGIGKASSSSTSSSRSSPFHTDVPSLWKQRATWESKSEVQDDSKHITEADQVLENRTQSISQMDVDTHLSDKEVSTNGFLKNEAVKEKTHRYEYKSHERIKIGSNKICIREDLATEKMVFSQESSQAVFEMGNVELIELKSSVIQCPSCLHYVF